MRMSQDRPLGGGYRNEAEEEMIANILFSVRRRNAPGRRDRQAIVARAREDVSITTTLNALRSGKRALFAAVKARSGHPATAQFSRPLRIAVNNEYGEAPPFF